MRSFLVVSGALLVLANLPFLSGRFMGVLPLSKPKSGIGLALEIGLCYALMLFFGRIAEGTLEGVAYAQGWEFYVVMTCLFVVAGFPGFVHRFFWSARRMA